MIFLFCFFFFHFIVRTIIAKRASQVAQWVKNLPAMQEMQTDASLIPCWEDPWRRAWQPTPGFLPGESQGQRNLAGYSP